MTRHQEQLPPSVVPSHGYKDVLLLRLGARFPAVDDVSTSAGGPSLRRLVGGQDYNVRGTPLAYAPHSFRYIEIS